MYRICRPCNKYNLFQTLMSLPNCDGKKNTFSSIRIQAEQMFHQLCDQSDIEYRRGNVRRNEPMVGKFKVKPKEIRDQCRNIVVENFEPELQLQCSPGVHILSN